MKKIIIIAATIFSSTFMFGQSDGRASVEDHDVRKGFYGNLNLNSTSPFDETYNLGIGGGMHFSENFHVGLNLMGGRGVTKRLLPHPIDLETNLVYVSFGIELGYEIPVHKNISIMPYFNQSFIKYKYSQNYFNYDNFSKMPNLKDNFLNTTIGAKVFFVANENIKIGANIGYGMANGANLYKTTSKDLSGISAGLTLQYNYFLPKW